jgi:hypothetical protein
MHALNLPAGGDRRKCKVRRTIYSDPSAWSQSDGHSIPVLERGLLWMKTADSLHT